MKNIEHILFEFGFKKIDNKFFLVSDYGRIVIHPEHRINEQYKARRYVRENTLTGDSVQGLIYTNNDNYFSSTLVRILDGFHSSNKEEEKYNFNSLCSLKKELG